LSFDKKGTTEYSKHGTGTSCFFIGM